MKVKDIIFIGLAAITLFSCAKNDAQQPQPQPQPQDEPLPPARVVSKEHDDEAGMTICRIEYPSQDPYGNPVTISGVITYGDEITESSPSEGIMLVNRYTAFGKTDCPSGGYLLIEKAMLNSKIVCVSSDHYGFGTTVDKEQAYCMGKTNAQTSIDCLLAARRLLPGLGVRFGLGKDDQIFNLGYSQGAQTAIGVLKLAAQKYPYIHFAHTFAGGGPYDIADTYRAMLDKGSSAMPHTVMEVIISYNSIYNLGYSLEDMFYDSAIKEIKEYIQSKEYSRAELDDLIKPQQFSEFLKPDMLNPESEMSKRFAEVFKNENLCEGWTPRRGERIFLSSHPNDDVVAPSSTQLLYNFLVEENGLSTVEWFPYSGVSIIVPSSVPRHHAATADFVLNVVRILRTEYNIPWFPDVTGAFEEIL